jgi:hypothetical protein
MTIVGTYGKEVASLGLGASLTAACFTAGEAPFSTSLKVGASAAACLYGCLKVRSYITQPQSVTEVSPKKTHATSGALLGVGAGVSLLALASILEKNALKYSGLFCLIPSVSYLSISSLKTGLKAKRNTQTSTSLDPLGKHAVLTTPLSKNSVRMPNAERNSNEKWVIPQSEVDRYNYEMGYVTDVHSREELERFTRDYAPFPAAQTPPPANKSGGAFAQPTRASAMGEHNSPPADTQLVRASSSAEILSSNSAVFIVEATHHLKLLKFAHDSYPLVQDCELEFETQQEAIEHITANLRNRPQAIQNMIEGFRRWAAAKK